MILHSNKQLYSCCAVVYAVDSPWVAITWKEENPYTMVNKLLNSYTTQLVAHTMLSVQWVLPLLITFLISLLIIFLTSFTNTYTQSTYTLKSSLNKLLVFGGDRKKQNIWFKFSTCFITKHDWNWWFFKTWIFKGF